MKKRSFIQVPGFMTLNGRLGLQLISKLASFVSNFGVGESIKQKTGTCKITILNK